jgi:hypothetical protein
LLDRLADIARVFRRQRNNDYVTDDLEKLVLPSAAGATRAERGRLAKAEYAAEKAQAEQARHQEQQARREDAVRQHGGTPPPGGRF